jgi:chromosome partitioning protein
MRTILIANRKGGCGKTMIAITLATALSRDGTGPVAIADADPQKSSLRWLKRRPDTAPPILGLDWTRSGNVGDAPKELAWLVIDAPGALNADRAARLVAEADCLVVPVLASFFDIDATRRFLKEIEDTKRVRKGKVRVHLVANRIRAPERATARLAGFFERIGQAPVATIGERTAYGALAERGFALFDAPQQRLEPLRAQWRPLLAALA